MATRYFFSQFWCEFTAEVLQEFFAEDIIYRRQEAATNAKLKGLEGLSEVEKQARMLKIMENKSSIF